MTPGGAVGKQSLIFAAIVAATVAGGIAFPIGSEARAETGAWSESAHAKVRLVSAVSATGTRRVQLGLEISLEPGWKTYWRAPGEGGMPPRFDWSGSANLANVDIAWPAPKPFEIGGLESVGYAGHVILPLDVSLANPGEPLAPRLSLQYAVCREICMLVEAKLSLDLPGPAQQTSESLTNAAAIAQFQARVPRPGAELGWRVAGVIRKTVGEGADRREVIVIDVANAGSPFGTPTMLFESPGLRFGKSMLRPAPDGAQARFVAAMRGAATALAGGDLLLTLIDGDRAGTFTVRVEPSAR